jgi:kinesin family protein 15
MFGRDWDGADGGSALESDEAASRGLVPRVLEMFFDRIDERPASSDSTCLVKCSFYEIYQEKVFDLLDSENSGAGGLAVREDASQGVYVENCTERVLQSVVEAKLALLKGCQSRRIAETAMNRESSRSHAIFQLMMEQSEARSCGVILKRTARLTMVDLAGSERQKDTHTTSSRLKEAAMINKSLSTLGRVINALAAIASEGSTTLYIPYRDSKLTFLLRDALGGNCKV